MLLLVLLRLIIHSPLLENFFPLSSARCWDTHQPEWYEEAKPLGKEPKMMLSMYVQRTLKSLLWRPWLHSHAQEHTLIVWCALPLFPVLYSYWLCMDIWWFNGIRFWGHVGPFPVLLLQAYPKKERLVTLGKEVSLPFTTGAVHNITLPLKPQVLSAGKWVLLSCMFPPRMVSYPLPLGVIQLLWHEIWECALYKKFLHWFLLYRRAWRWGKTAEFFC